MAKRTAIGIDIGGTEVRAAEVSVDGDTIEVLRYAMEPLGGNAVREGVVLDQAAVTQALKALWSRGGFKTKDVVLGVGNQRVTVRSTPMPKMPLADLQSALPFQVGESLPMPVDEAVLGYYPTSEAPSDHGPVYEGLLVAASNETVMSTVGAAEAAGLVPQVVDLNGFALLRAIVRGPLAAGTVALVDLGARLTTVVIATNGLPRFVRSLPVGALDLSDALSRSVGMSSADAEQLLWSHGLAIPNAPDFAAAAGPFGDATTQLVDGVRGSIGFHSSTNPQEPVGTVVLTGGGASVPGLGQSVASATRVRTMIGNPLDGLVIAKRVRSMEYLRGREATMAVAIGLGMAVAA